MKKLLKAGALSGILLSGSIFAQGKIGEVLIQSSIKNAVEGRIVSSMALDSNSTEKRKEAFAAELANLKAKKASVVGAYEKTLSEAMKNIVEQESYLKKVVAQLDGHWDVEISLEIYANETPEDADIEIQHKKVFGALTTGIILSKQGGTSPNDVIAAYDRKSSINGFLYAPNYFLTDGFLGELEQQVEDYIYDQKHQIDAHSEKWKRALMQRLDSASNISEIRKNSEQR